MSETKTCKICGHTGPLSDFYRHVGHKGGYMSKCKVCTNEGRMMIDKKGYTRPRKPAGPLPEKTKAFLHEMLTLWAITQERKIDATVEDFVCGYLHVTHSEAAIARGNYQDEEATRRRRARSSDKKLKGLCVECGKRPIDYSRGRSICTECLDKCRDRKRAKVAGERAG